MSVLSYLLRYTVVVVLTTLISSCAGHTATSGRVVLVDNDAAAEAAFTDRDRALIKEYYQKLKLKSGASSPAANPRARKGTRLPADAPTEPLPYALEEKLSRLSPAYGRVRSGRDIVLLEKQSRVVKDVIYDGAI